MRWMNEGECWMDANWIRTDSNPRLGGKLLKSLIRTLVLAGNFWKVEFEPSSWRETFEKLNSNPRCPRPAVTPSTWHSIEFCGRCIKHVGKVRQLLCLDVSEFYWGQQIMWCCNFTFRSTSRCRIREKREAKFKGTRLFHFDVTCPPTTDRRSTLLLVLVVAIISKVATTMEEFDLQYPPPTYRQLLYPIPNLAVLRIH